MKQFIKRLIAKRVAKLTAKLTKEYNVVVTTQRQSPNWDLYVDIGNSRRIILRNANLDEMHEVAMLVSWYLDIPFIKTIPHHVGYVNKVNHGNTMVEYNPKLA